MSKLRDKWAPEPAGDDDDEQGRVERLQRAEADPEWFCQYYLAESFQHPETKQFSGLAEWQQEVLALSTEKGNDAFAAPRGHGKTTFLSFALTLRDMIIKRALFTVYISSTFTAACDRISEIRLELETNERIREDFGDLLLRRSGTRVSASDLRLSNGTRIVARGSCQAIRGLKNRAARPDRIILDDVDKDDESQSLERLAKRIRWFKKVVMGLAGAGGCKIIVVGNIIARKTLLTDCLANKTFRARVYSAIKDDGTPLMPGLWSIAALTAKRDEIGSDAFNTEYQNRPPASETAPFRPNWLERRWTPELLAAALDSGQAVLVASLDLSKGKTEQSDYQAMVAVVRWKSTIFIMAADINRRPKKALVRRSMAFCEALGLNRLVSFVVEANGFQEWFGDELKEVSAETGHDLPIRLQTHLINKYERVSRLTPFAEGGRLLFPPIEDEDESIRLLRNQLEEFPDGKHDDGPDALEMAVTEAGRLIRGSDALVIPLNPMRR
ncbi:MAG: hypothetical protein GC208_10355 [Alphaproteobacteria bacterium]|nr:hypothetical protein [Alphaproteobacteria bacterium]